MQEKAMTVTQKETVFFRIEAWMGRLLEGNQAGREKNTIAVLDGVRALAILMVIVFHINRMTGDNLWDWRGNPLASSVSTAGGTGVTLFFVLSGFLLFMPFAKSLLFKKPWPLVRVYYMRRILRIWPGYYVSLFLLIFFLHPEYLQPDHRIDLVLFLTFFMDSARRTFRQLNGPYWTLATEWQFYMLLPLLALAIAWLVMRVPREKRLQAVIWCLLGVIGCGLLVRWFGLYYLDHPGPTWIPPLLFRGIMFLFFGITGKYTEDFAVGMLISACYIYAQQAGDESRFVQRWRQISPWLWRAGIVILVFSAMWHFNAGEPAWPFLNGLMPVFSWLSEMVLAIGYGACIAAILYGPAGLQRHFAWNPLRWIGLISYSLYIWHLPLLIVFATYILPLFHIANHFLTYLLFWTWALLVIFPFATLFYLMIERPFMRLGDRWRKGIERRHKEKLKARELAKARAMDVALPASREEGVSV